MIRIAPTTVCVGKFYHRAPELIWDLVTDTLKWPLWGPTVQSARCSERYIRSGSKGHILTPFGIRLPFIVTEYEHVSFWSWRVGSIKATGHRIEGLNTCACNLWFEIPLVAAPYVLICRKALENINKLVSGPAKAAV